MAQGTMRPVVRVGVVLGPLLCSALLGTALPACKGTLRPFDGDLGRDDLLCGGITCSGHGTCVVVDGRASCVCDPDYGVTGDLRCEPVCTGTPTLAAPLTVHAAQFDTSTRVFGDAHGGLWLVWSDTMRGVFAQHLLADGTTTPPVRVSSAGVPGNQPSGAVADGTGGILLYGGGRLQRLSAAGQLLWGDAGLDFSGCLNFQLFADGRGGGFVKCFDTANDPHGASMSYPLTVQRLDGSGRTLWGAPLHLNDPDANYEHFFPAADGGFYAGLCRFAWGETLKDTFQRFSAAGAERWSIRHPCTDTVAADPVDGVLVFDQPARSLQQIRSDGRRGFRATIVNTMEGTVQILPGTSTRFLAWQRSEWNAGCVGNAVDCANGIVVELIDDAGAPRFSTDGTGLRLGTLEVNMRLQAVVVNDFFVTAWNTPPAYNCLVEEWNAPLCVEDVRLAIVDRTGGRLLGDEGMLLDAGRDSPIVTLTATGPCSATVLWSAGGQHYAQRIAF
jgi:hypothetical protein